MPALLKGTSQRARANRELLAESSRLMPPRRGPTIHSGCSRDPQMFCASCIRKWLERSADSQCPHCRKALTEASTVNCRWADEVVDRLDDVQPLVTAATAGEGSVPPQRVDWCSKHGADLTVHCVTCHVSLCYHGALWDEEHKDHTFHNLRDVYNQRVDLIRSQLPHLRSRQKELLKLMQVVEHNVEDMWRERDVLAEAVRRQADTAVASLDATLQGRMAALLDRKNTLSEQTKTLGMLLHKVESQLQAKSRSSLIRHSAEFAHMLEKTQQLPSMDDEQPRVTADFVNEYVPPCETGELRISPFTRLRQSCLATDAVFSETLQSDGMVWRLKAYPSGTLASHGSQLSVFLELLEGPPGGALPPNCSRFEFAIEVAPAAAVRSGGQRDCVPFVREHGEAAPRPCLYRIPRAALPGAPRVPLTRADPPGLWSTPQFQPANSSRASAGATSGSLSWMS